MSQSGALGCSLLPTEETPPEARQDSIDLRQVRMLCCTAGASADEYLPNVLCHCMRNEQSVCFPNLFPVRIQLRGCFLRTSDRGVHRLNGPTNLSSGTYWLLCGKLIAQCAGTEPTTTFSHPVKVTSIDPSSGRRCHLASDGMIATPGPCSL